MILGRRSNPPMSFVEAGTLQGLLATAPMNSLKVLVNTNEGEGMTFLFLGSTIALIIVALVIIAIIVCELRRPAPSADGRRDSRTDAVIIA
ncbi:Oidioi.mRNA.OKI2018_I69.chr2.g7086.t1.cds [Oikopleura dioica]|uniref:Oidioi.mRNA.OKI2018_I69.chr2.g7086.t1.cds n=1 Tax=Oikopleura dioica TaxID=34765 RepID=A0ABN7T8J5_OIKDI|nr:Oidioi.mRNA.OKI2018_I69.chr2.g7086.t1.cds [Oikopleura dioica]